MLDDMPRGFGGYRPENFDHTFRGEVRVKDALQHSLNVPAVATLERVGVDRFSAALRATGAKVMQRKRSDGRPSLALALGGVGVTMRDVATLYSGLANGGRVRPIAWKGNASPQPGVQLLAGDTAERINAILRGSPSLSGRAPAALATAAPIVAYKTGTSYDYRDAWAAGHASRIHDRRVGREGGRRAPTRRNRTKRCCAASLRSLRCYDQRAKRSPDRLDRRTRCAGARADGSACRGRAADDSLSSAGI